MIKSKILTLFRTFSPIDWKALEKYLHSPYLNSNKRAIVFYNYLKKYHPRFDHRHLEKPVVFASIFPEKKKFDDRLLRATMADLHKIAESFLVAEQLKKEKRTQKKILTRSYAERGLYDRFEKNIHTILDSIQNSPSKGMDDYLDTFILNQAHYFHPQTNALITAPKTLKKAVTSLDEFYALAKLRLFCELGARSKIVAGKTEYPMLAPVLSYIEKSSLDKDPVIGIYLSLLKINSEGVTEQLFFDLKNKYLKYRKLLQFSEQKEILVYLLNYAYRLALSIDKSFYKEQFELYKIGLKNNHLLENELLPDLRFTNIAAVSSMVKEWAWTKNFIQAYSPLLHKEVAQDAIYLAESYLYFHQGDFLATDEMINKITSNKLNYKLRQYSLSIRSLFEITLIQDDYLELLLYRIHAYEKYLGRQKILSQKRILAESNFTRLIKKICTLLPDKHITSAQWIKVKLEVAATSPLAAKEWLLEKLSNKIMRDK